MAKYSFTQAERQALLQARALTPGGDSSPSPSGNWSAFYTTLSEILGNHIDAGTVTGQELQDFKSAKLWTDVAISANGGVGLHSTFIRTATAFPRLFAPGAPFFCRGNAKSVQWRGAESLSVAEWPEIG